MNTMRVAFLLLLSLVLVQVACLDGAEDASDEGLATYQAALRGGVPPNGVYIVVLRSGSPEDVARGVGVEPDMVYRHALNGFAARLPEPALNGLLHNPHVSFIEADAVFQAVAQTVPTGIDRMELDLNPSWPPAAIDVDVAVLDTGIDATHPDLYVFRQVDCARSKGCRVGSAPDRHSHGTHVAGIIGARNNDLGVVGVAPGARLWAIKVLGDDGSGYLSWIIGGIDYVKANAAAIEVANMSIGGTGSDDIEGQDCHLSTDAYHLAICNAVGAGVVFVVAAGNEMDDAANHRPGTYDEVITVSALADFDGIPGGLDPSSYTFSACTESDDDSLACFSNYGHDVDIMAPGVLITSTIPVAMGGYGVKSGTSMASPYVAGLAALYTWRNGAPTDAAGVAAVRDALVFAGIPQDGPCGLAFNDDPDLGEWPEPLAFGNAAVVGGSGECEAGCEFDAECDDSDPCTGDELCFDGACMAGDPEVCESANPCEIGVCDPADGLCDFSEMLCDDGNLCNGTETCSNGVCQDGSPVDCDDADLCTVDGCAPATGECVYQAVFCDDGDECTADSCDALTGCVYAPIPNCLPVIECLPLGARCAVSSECCSLNCRGKCR